MPFSLFWRPLQEADLSVDQILQNHLAALGGIDKLNAIQNVILTGHASLMGGQLRAPVTVRVKRPASMRMEMRGKGQTFVQAFDGKTAWLINRFVGSPEPRKSSEDDNFSAH